MSDAPHASLLRALEAEQMERARACPECERLAAALERIAGWNRLTHSLLDAQVLAHETLGTSFPPMRPHG